MMSEECEFPALIKNDDAGLKLVRMAVKSLLKAGNGEFDESKFATCNYKGLGLTTVSLGEQTARVCDKHGTTVRNLGDLFDGSAVPDKKPSQVAGGFTAAELSGKFSGLRGWSQSLEGLQGERAQTWRTAMLSTGQINALGGRQAVRDGVFSLSYFTYGYYASKETGMRTACIYLPALKAQVELYVDDVEGTGVHAWESRALLTSVCKRRDYRDGLNGDGVGFFEAEPVINLADRIAEATRLVAADLPQELYVASPERRAQLGVAKSMWETHKEKVLGTGADGNYTVDSPGRLYAGRIGRLDAQRQPVYGTEALCECCGALNQRGEGIACACGHVARSEKMRSPTDRKPPPPAAVLTSTSLSEHIGDFMNLLRGGSERDEPDWLGSRSTSGVDMSAKAGPGVAPPRHGGGRAEDQSGPRNSGGPPDDDGDDDDDDDEEAELDPEEQKRDAFVNRAVRMVINRVANSPEAKKLFAVQAVNLHRLAAARDAELLVQQGKIAAMVLVKQGELARQIETQREAHLERMQKDAQQHSDEAADRKKTAEQFPPGIVKTVAFLRDPGRGDILNRTGDRSNGKVFPTIGAGLTNIGKLYLAMLAAACETETQDAFGCDLTEAMCYNFWSLRLGGAPSAIGSRDGKPSCGLEFGGASSIYDFRSRKHSNARKHGVRYVSKEVPKMKNIKFIDNSSRSKGHFLDIYALEAAFKNMGKIAAMAFGGAFYEMFALCGRRVRELHEYDAHTYHEDMLSHLSNVAIYQWTQLVFRLSEDPDYQLSEYQLQLSDSLGFDLPTPTPGDGFARDSPFMRDNYHLPMDEDVKTSVRQQLSTLPDAVKAAQGFSGLPHVSHAPSVSPATLPAAMPPKLAKPRLGGSYSRGGDDSDGDDDDDERLGRDEDDDEDWVATADLEMAMSLGSDEFWSWLLGSSPKAVRVAEGAQRGRDGNRGPSKGGTVKMIRLPRDFLKSMYASFPKAKDPRTGAPVDVCVRSLCHPALGPDNKPCGKTACSTDPKHALHRPGENQCNRFHPPSLANGAPGLLTELMPGHVALCLVHGGIRGLPRPPNDLNGLQAEALRWQQAQDNNASLGPLTWLGGDESEEAATPVANGDGGGQLGASGASPGRAVVPDWGTPTAVQAAAGILKVGLLRVPRLQGEYTVSDLGGKMKSTGRGHREGSNCCILKTLGAVLSVYGYPEDEYFLAAKAAFEETDVASEQRRVHEQFSTLLTGTGKLTLDMVGHVGLPAGVALVVVQSFDTGRVKMVIFTDGRPKRVVFAHISGTHIMPMTAASKPFGMTWADFAPAHEAWQAAGGQVTVVITKRCLPDHLEGTTVTLHPAARVGGSDPDSDDKELVIALGTNAANQVVRVADDDEQDDPADTALMVVIKTELKEFVVALDSVLGFGESYERIAAVLRGEVRGVQDFWQQFPIIHQYYKARLRREELYATHFDPATTRFAEHVWDRSGPLKAPYPFPHLFRSLVYGLHEAGEQYAACLLVSVFHRHKLQQRQAAMLIALSLCDCTGDPRYDTPVWLSDATKRKLVASLNSLVDGWCLDKAARPIVLSHLIAQSPSEWKTRVGDQVAQQWLWVQHLIQEFDSYLKLRSSDKGFVARPLSSDESKHQCENVGRKLRRERATGKRKRDGDADTSSHCESKAATVTTDMSLKGSSPRVASESRLTSTPSSRTAIKPRAVESTKVKLTKVTPGFYYTDSDDDEPVVRDNLTRREARLANKAQIDADAKLAKDMAIAWTAEEDARDNLAEQHEQKHAEGKIEEEEADEEEPGSDDECHRCEQTGLSLKGSKVRHGAWSCAKCEAELVLAAEDVDVANTLLETAKDVAGMTAEAVVSPDTLRGQVNDETGTVVLRGTDEADDEVGASELGNEDGQYGQSRAGRSDSEVTAVCRWQSYIRSYPGRSDSEIAAVCRWQSGTRSYRRLTPEAYALRLEVYRRLTPEAYEPPPPDEHFESDFLKALGETVSNNRNKASQAPALKVMDSAYFAPIIAGGSTKDVEETEALLRLDSPAVRQLQPLVHELHAATAALKAAFESGEVTGEARRTALQNGYIKAADALCEKTVSLCPNRWWPQLFITAYRAPHPGRVNPHVDPRAVETAFQGKINPEVLRVIVDQATYGTDIYLDRRTKSGWPEATVKDHIHEVWRVVWTDVAYSSTILFGPSCSKHMNLAEMEGFPLLTVAKKCTATGNVLPTKIRLIAHLSYENAEGSSINSATMKELYGSFGMPVHADVARGILAMQQWFPGVPMGIVKLDVRRAFREKYLGAASFGTLAFRLSGHYGVEATFNFGHTAAPTAYNPSGRAIHEAHNASSVYLTGAELRDANYSGIDWAGLTDEQTVVTLAKTVPILNCSETYADDGILIVPKIPKIQAGTVDSYKGFMRAALGEDAVSTKDPEEQEWSDTKTVIGLRFELGREADARGDTDFLTPTSERISLMRLLMDDVQFTPEGKDRLTAGLCARAFSLWLWMCVCCPRLKAFIGSFKRVFEGKTAWKADDVVSPVRANDEPDVAWMMFWNDMTTLKMILKQHDVAPDYFRVPLWRLLPELEQLSIYGHKFKRMNTDACTDGGGAICLSGPVVFYFRVAFPAWVKRDIRACMARRKDDEASTQYTIGVAEKAMHTLALKVFSEENECYIMGQDNQNVIRWTNRGWGFPLRVQNYLRQDVALAQHRNTWSIIEYVTSEQNDLADLLSRSFTEDGSSRPEVMEEFHERLRRKGLVGQETLIPVDELHRLMCAEVESWTGAQLVQQATGTEETQGEAILLGSAEDPEVSCTWLGGLRSRTCVKRPEEATTKPKQAPNRPQTRADSTRRGSVKEAQVCEFSRFLNEDEAGCRKVLEAAKRKFGPGDGLWTCSGGAEAVGNHTLAEGLGLGRGVVGVFCARHDHTLREVAEDMTRRELDPSGTRLASAEEPAPLEPEEEEYAEVERIIQQRDHQAHGLQYKVRWLNCNNTRNSWVCLEDLNCPELLATFTELQRQRGMPDVGATDAQAEKFYYGPQTENVGKGKRTHDGPEPPEKRHSVSTGPHHTAPWVRPVQRSRAATDAAAHRGPSTTVWETHGFSDRGLAQRSNGNSVFRDRGVALDLSQSLEPRQQARTLTRAMMHDRPQPEGRSSEGAFAAGGKGRGKGSTLPAPARDSTREYAPNVGKYMGTSLADKVDAAAQTGRSRRVELVIDGNDDRLLLAAAQTLAFSLSKNTQRAYGGNFNFFLGFCQRQNLSPFLDGTNKRSDEATLIQYIMYEWDVHKNKYATIKLKLAAVRPAMMEEEYPNPLEGKFTLDRHLKGMKTMRGATNAKEPLPMEAFRNILEQTRGAPLMVRAAALACVTGAFWLLRISEVAGRDKSYMEPFILQRCDVTFYTQGKLSAWNRPDVDAVELHIRGSKTDQKQQSCRRVQEASGDPVLCPVKCMVEWFTLTEGSAIPSNAPLFSVPKGREGLEWEVLTRDVVTLLIKGAAADCGMDTGLVGTHSIRISGATALLLAGVPPAVVQIIGRWASNAFIGYTRYQAELMKGVATRMVNAHYVARPRLE